MKKHCQYRLPSGDKCTGKSVYECADCGKAICHAHSYSQLPQSQGGGRIGVWVQFCKDCFQRRIKPTEAQLKEVEELHQKDSIRTKEHNLLVQENRKLKCDLEKYHLCCGEMRALIEDFRPICSEDPDDIERINLVLSYTSGASLFDELKKLREDNKWLREACEKSKEALTQIMQCHHLNILSCPCGCMADDALEEIKKAQKST